jgi:hypothetical protein
MDILAAMFAYLVCIAGLVTGLVMSFMIFFAAPGAFSAPPTDAIAMVAGPTLSPNLSPSQSPIHGSPSSASSAKTIAKVSRSDGQMAAAMPAADAPVAIDARQKPLFTQAHFRRLAEKERAKQLAYRERSSFETRFLHFDD